MDVNKKAETSTNHNLYIVEKFSDVLGLPFDSIQALSELEIFRRNKKDTIHNNSFEELKYLGVKFGIFLTTKKISTDRIFKSISPSFPVAVYTKKFGWILISHVLGPLVRFTKITSSETAWTFKSKIEKWVSSHADNKDLPEWIQLDNRFHSLGVHEPNHPTYKDSILEFIQIEKRDIWAITIYSIAMGLFSLIIPIGVQSLVNILNFGTLFQPVLVLTLLVFFALGLVGLMNVLQSYVAELVQQRLFVRLAAKVIKVFPKTNYSESREYFNSEVPNYFLDISIIQKSATILLTNGLGIFLQTIIGLLVLVAYHPVFIIFNIIIITFVIGIIFYLIGSVGVETSIKESKSKHKLASWIQELNIHQTIFRSEKSHEYLNLRTENLVRDYIHARRKHFKALMRQMIGFVSLQAFGSGLLLGIGGWLVIHGQITLGQLVASEIIVTKILDNFGKITKYLENYYDLCASIDKVNHLTDFSLEESGAELLLVDNEKPISISIKNLLIEEDGYDPFQVSMNIKKKEIIVIQNATPKITEELFNILYGLKSYKKGTIEINDHYLQDFKLPQWRNHVSLLRNLEIFSGTIAENIKLGSFSSDSAEIKNILEQLNLLKKIQSFPKGIYSEILRNGYPFSKEELALIVIARALLLKPSLILIDEILMYLTKDSLNLLANILKEYKKYSTIIIASTLPEISKISDRTFIFKGTELIENGK